MTVDAHGQLFIHACLATWHPKQVVVMLVSSDALPFHPVCRGEDCNVLSCLVLAQDYDLPAFHKKCSDYLYGNLPALAGALKKSEIRDIASKVLAALPREVLASFAVDLLGVAGEARIQLFLQPVGIVGHLSRLAA